MHILVAEDDRKLAEALKQILTEQKYQTEIVENGQDAAEYILHGNYDLALLDVMMPEMDGYAVVRQVRKAENSIPILMLTARDTIPDKVQGLESGADDYMTKPFAAEELLARIRALSRRQGEFIPDEKIVGDLQLNTETGQLSCGKQTVKLSYKELELMKQFLTAGNTVLSKETMLTKVWGADSDVEENTIEVYVSFLRKKLKFLHSSMEIRNYKKLGYRLEEQ